MPAKSRDQQKFMALVHAYQKGELDTSKMSPGQKASIRRTAASIKFKDAKDFAETKHKGLPEKVAIALDIPKEIVEGVFSKLAQHRLYRQEIRRVSTKERIIRGIKNVALPSAALTGAVVASQLFFRKQPKILSRAMKAAVNAALITTPIGALLTPKQRRVFIPVNR